MENKILAISEREEIPGEIWKKVKDFEDFYWISSYGRLYREKLNSWGDKICGIVRTSKNNFYINVKLTTKEKERLVPIHVLVAEAFIPNPENKPVVNHINHNKHDNRVENLEWATYSENTKAYYEHKRRKDENATRSDRRNYIQEIQSESSGNGDNSLSSNDKCNYSFYEQNPIRKEKEPKVLAVLAPEILKWKIKKAALIRNMTLKNFVLSVLEKEVNEILKI